MVSSTSCFSVLRPRIAKYLVLRATAVKQCTNTCFVHFPLSLTFYQQSHPMANPVASIEACPYGRLSGGGQSRKPTRQPQSQSVSPRHLPLTAYLRGAQFLFSVPVSVERVFIITQCFSSIFPMKTDGGPGGRRATKEGGEGRGSARRREERIVVWDGGRAAWALEGQWGVIMASKLFW